MWYNNEDKQYEEKTKDIERGIYHERMGIVPKSSDAERIYLDLLKSANREIMLLFPTTNAFLRQYKLYVIDSITDAAIFKNIRVRVLVPKNEPVDQLLKIAKDKAFISNSANKIEFRYIQQLLETRSTILIIDSKVSLVMELKDDSKQSFSEAIGLSIYSNSKPGVLSYVSIFENLWKITELYQELKKSNEQLRHNEILQRFYSYSST